MNEPLSFQQLQAHVCRTQVTADANQVVELGAVAIDDILLLRHAQTGDRDGQAGHRRAGVAAHDVHVVTLARQADTAEQRLDVLHRETLADAERNSYLSRRTIHRVDVREIDHGGLVAQVLQRHIFQIEMNALQQHIRRHQDARFIPFTFHL